MEQAARLAAQYLVARTQPDGRYVYRVNIDPTVEVRPGYNILRHAGAIYALAMFHERYPDGAVLDAIRRSIGYLRRTSISPFPGAQHALAVWSRPEVSGEDDPLEAKLGGAGLGLIALLSYDRIEPGQLPLDEMRALGRFVLAMQKPDGSFYSKYVPAQDDPLDDWESLYYPGEVALGLTLLYDKDPDPAWLQAADRALQFLARSRAGQAVLPPDHWSLIATERILSVQPPAAVPIDREPLLRHTAQIARSMLQDQSRADQQTQASLAPILDGCFYPDGRTTPSATRLEGLYAALQVLPRQDPLHEAIRSATERGIGFLLRSQVREGPFQGAFPRGVIRFRGSTPQVESFNRRVLEVRIDYVQHALSAILRHLDLLRAEGTEGKGAKPSLP